MPDLSLFHFAVPLWAWLLVFPIGWCGWLLLRASRKQEQQEVDTRFADAHLLPYLRVKEVHEVQKQKPSWLWGMAVWGLAWACLTLAMMGPRWEREAQPLLEPDSNVMVVLDISSSMRARDLVPDRMERARQELGAFFEAAEAKGVKVGLIGYAAKAVLISPLTRDMNSLRKLLPSLGPELVQLQGSDPSEALELARRQLQHQSAAQGVKNLHILLVTDGDMTEAGEVGALVAAMAGTVPSNEAQPIMLHVLAAGTVEGAPVPDDEGHYLTDKSGKVHLSHLNVALMKQWVEAGKGRYLQANALQAVSPGLIATITQAGNTAASRWHESWKERFLIPLLMGMLLLMWRTP